MRISVLSEVFWEAIKHFNDIWGDILTSFRAYLMTERAKTYAESLRGQGTLLLHCTVFIDCTKIQNCRPGGEIVNKRACYWK